MKSGQALTLTIGAHVRHASRASAGHHVRTAGEGTLGAHWELLWVVHHRLRLVWHRTGLHMRILWRWGTSAIETWPRRSVGKAIGSRVHGL